MASIASLGHDESTVGSVLRLEDSDHPCGSLALRPLAGLQNPGLGVEGLFRLSLRLQSRAWHCMPSLAGAVGW